MPPGTVPLTPSRRYSKVLWQLALYLGARVRGRCSAKHTHVFPLLAAVTRPAYRGLGTLYHDFLQTPQGDCGAGVQCGEYLWE